MTVGVGGLTGASTAPGAIGERTSPPCRAVPARPGRVGAVQGSSISENGLRGLQGKVCHSGATPLTVPTCEDDPGMLLSEPFAPQPGQRRGRDDPAASHVAGRSDGRGQDRACSSRRLATARHGCQGSHPDTDPRRPLKPDRARPQRGGDVTRDSTLWLSGLSRSGTRPRPGTPPRPQERCGSQRSCPRGRGCDRPLAWQEATAPPVISRARHVATLAWPTTSPMRRPIVPAFRGRPGSKRVFALATRASMGLRRPPRVQLRSAATIGLRPARRYSAW